MSMSDREFHDRAKSLKPDQAIKPTRYWVGILYHDKKVSEVSQEAEFLWIKAHGKITVQTIREQYFTKSPIEIALKLNDSIPPKEARLADLNIYNDNVIIFRALELNAPDLQQRRQPLSPVNRQFATYPVTPGETARLDSWNQDHPWTKHQQFNEKVCQNENVPVKEEAHEIEAPAIQQVVDFPSQKNSIQSSMQAIPFNHHQSNEYVRSIGTSNRNTFDGSTNGITERLVAGQGWSANAHRSPQPPAQIFDSPQKEVTRPVKIQPLPLANLQKLLMEVCPEVLEQGFTTGLELLKLLEAPLRQYSGMGDAQQWLQRVQALQMQAVRSKTTIGVVGNTGAGKSSVINALLDEERLVPTNCMRACTAVVTQLSWNDVGDDDEEHKYRAEIEFIKATEWEKELRILFDDLLDSNGNVSREASNPDSDAGIAYAKIRAVYPQKTKEDLAASSVAGLMSDSTVSSVLGSTVKINSSQPDRFYSRLQNYVDSKDKVGGRKKERNVEYWPLIKVVRVYTKANALSTGAVIVDLPGVHDSNAARAAVADGYMKQCSGLWIVAPITRAVDDKAAKSLLGDSFKRQLKYDGTYSNVTFICSKTDDISIQEASETLELEEEMQQYFSELTELTKEKRRIKTNISELREKKETFDDLMNDLADKEEIWEGLEDNCRDGEIVYAPCTNESKKRKRGCSPSQSPKKRRRCSESGSEAAYQDDTCATEDEDKAGSDEDILETDDTEDKEPTTLEAILAEIDDLRKLKKEMRREKSGLDQPLRELTTELKNVERKEEVIEAKISARCISGRNSYSKIAIRQDFAAGIKELDQENAAETDEANFNPDEDIRDYDEVARSLPVFCVSSRAYQRLSGRFKKEKDVPGFVEVEETEVPQLQAHCKKMTESGRSTNCRRFLNSLSQLLNSLSLWATNYAPESVVLHSSRKPGAKFLENELAELQNSLYQIVRSTVIDLKELLQDNIYEKYPKAVQAASSKATPTAQRWGAPVNRSDVTAGGLYWATYKAICRRDGVFANARGTYDFNGQLAEPMIKHLSTGWEKAFARNLPRILDGFRRTTSALLKGFHKMVEYRAQELQLNLPGLGMLSQQPQVYATNLADVSGAVREKINATQREASREFTPVIRAAMLVAYNYCNAERGQGCFARMKAYMNAHTENECDYMFARATEHVTNILTSMCLEVESQMVCQVDSILDCIKTDYRGVIAGGPENEAHAESLKDLRQEIVRFLIDADNRFAVGETDADVLNREDDNGNRNNSVEGKRYAVQCESLEESDNAAENMAENGRQHDTVSAEPINSTQSAQPAERSISEKAEGNVAKSAIRDDEDEQETRFFNAPEANSTGEAIEARPRSAGRQEEGEDRNEEPEYDCCWADIMSDPYDDLANCCEEDYVDGEEDQQ